MDLLKWYKNKVESNDLDPPVDTWDNIQDQLDIDNSWQVIDRYLDRRERFIGRLRISAAASFLALALAGAGWIYFSLSGQDGLQELAGEETVPARVIDPTTDDTAGEKGIDADQSFEPTDQNNPVSGLSSARTKNLVAIADEKLREEVLKTADDVVYKDDDEAINEILFGDYKAERTTPVAKKPAMVNPDLSLLPLEENLNIVIEPGISYQEKPARERKSFRKFYVGTTGQLANTWLVNQKTISGFKSASLVSTNATFGSNFGFFAGTNLLRRLDLQTDFNLLAQNNQDYNEYLDGHYVNSKLKLDYSQFALSLRYYIVSDRFLEGEHGINFGGYMAYLHNAYQKIDGETYYISNTYNKIDYGLLLAYEYIFPLYGQLGLGTGFRAYYGLNNIYAGDDYIPSYMNVTNNASVNITLSLKYLLK